MLALEHGYWNVAAAIRWADRLIQELPEPPVEILELATLRSDRRGHAIRLLRPLASPREDPGDPLKLALLIYALVEGKVDAPTVWYRLLCWNWPEARGPNASGPVSKALAEQLNDNEQLDWDPEAIMTRGFRTFLQAQIDTLPRRLPPADPVEPD